MKLYITGMSLFVLAVFYLPLVLWALWKLLKRPIPTPRKTALIILLLAIAYAIPLGDVTINSLAMAKVCPTAGLHIYKTVEVEGFVGSTALRDAPYRFNESPTRRVDGTYYWRRFEKQPDGSISVTELENPTAEYEVIDGQWSYDQKRGVLVMRDMIRNRISGEVLAESFLFNSLPGWLDRVLVYRWFGSGRHVDCNATTIEKTKILIPNQSNR